jgi:YVTN family beta-propeller protein
MIAHATPARRWTAPDILVIQLFNATAETLALRGGTAWSPARRSPPSSASQLATRARRATAFQGSPIAVVNALGAIWALDTSGVVSHLDPGSAKVTARIQTGMAGPYNLWAGARSLWSADDRSGEIVRIDPARRRVVARIPVGDGPADMVFSNGRAWVVNHRDLAVVVSTRPPTGRGGSSRSPCRTARPSGSPGRRDRSG